jgi:hypothetical protein
VSKRHTRIAGAREGTPIKLKAGKGTKQQRQDDIRAANAIGFLAGVLLKALDSRIEERLAHLEAVMTNRGAESEAFDFRPAKERPHEHPSATTEGD